MEMGRGKCCVIHIGQVWTQPVSWTYSKHLWHWRRFFFFFTMFRCAQALSDGLLGHLECIAACLTPTLRFLCCGILQSSCCHSVVGSNEVSWSQLGKRWRTQFSCWMLENQGLQRKRWTLGSCLAVGIRLSYLPKVSKPGIPAVAVDVYRLLTPFCVLEKASPISGI